MAGVPFDHPTTTISAEQETRIGLYIKERLHNIREEQANDSDKILYLFMEKEFKMTNDFEDLGVDRAILNPINRCRKEANALLSEDRHGSSEYVEERSKTHRVLILKSKKNK